MVLLSPHPIAAQQSLVLVEEKPLWPRGWVTQGLLNILATERGPPGQVLPSLGPGDPAYTEEELTPQQHLVRGNDTCFYLTQKCCVHGQWP